MEAGPESLVLSFCGLPRYRMLLDPVARASRILALTWASEDPEVLTCA